MIELTRLKGNGIVLNSDLIKTAESSPDTMLTLITGEKLIVREEPQEVVSRVLAYRAQLLKTVARSSLGQISISALFSLLGLSASDAPPEETHPGREAASVR